MCLRQKGQTNPRLKTRSTFVFPVKSERETSTPRTSFNVKSGAGVLIWTFFMKGSPLRDYSWCFFSFSTVSRSHTSNMAPHPPHTNSHSFTLRALLCLRGALHSGHLNFESSFPFFVLSFMSSPLSPLTKSQSCLSGTGLPASGGVFP